MLVKFTDEEFLQFGEFGFVEATVKKTFPMHLHSYSELVIITHGTAIHKIGSQKFSIKRGDVYIAGGDVPHGFEEADNCIMYNFQYNDFLYQDYRKGLCNLPGFEALFIVKPLLRNGSVDDNFLHLNDEEICIVDDIFKDMELLKNNSLKNKDTIKFLFFTVMSLISNKYNHIINNDKSLKTIIKILDFVNKNYSSKITLTSLSKKYNISSRHIQRLCNKYCNQSIGQYISQGRIEKAMSYLNSSTLPINEIATLCGYQDCSYFSRIFKQFVGISPTEYIKLSVIRGSNTNKSN